MLLVCLLLSACRVAPPPANGWAIVAVNPQTGDVGVAGASCSEYPFDYRAALIPKRGALAQLGVASPLQRDRASAWIETPFDAPTLVQRITRPANDAAFAKRAWAVVTMRDGRAQAARFVGAENAPYAASQEHATAQVVVIGTALASSNVVSDALTTFQVNSNTYTLADNLLRALEAGSAAGGIGLCNQNGVQQTASSAFVMLARGEEPKFQVNTLGNSAPQEAEPPSLALSVTEPIGGRNAVAILRAQYNAWRQANLPACAECLQAAANVPRGGAQGARNTAHIENALWLVAVFIVAVMLLTTAYFGLRPRMGHSTHLDAT